MKKLKVKKYVSFYINSDSSVYDGTAINNLFQIENGYLIQFNSGITFFSNRVKNTDSRQEAYNFAAGESPIGW